MQVMFLIYDVIPFASVYQNIKEFILYVFVYIVRIGEKKINTEPSYYVWTGEYVLYCTPVPSAAGVLL